jgi:RNA polymerase sigma-70 factor (ECF subfamily)
MKTLNLRDYHPSLYTSDCFIEVSDEVEDIFITSKQNEDAYHSRKYITRHNISLIGTMVLNTIF